MSRAVGRASALVLVSWVTVGCDGTRPGDPEDRVASLDLAPDSATIVAEIDTLEYAVGAWDASGAPVAVPDLTWSVADPRLSDLDEAIVFDGTKVSGTERGVGWVIAGHDEVRDSAFLWVQARVEAIRSGFGPRAISLGSKWRLPLDVRYLAQPGFERAGMRDVESNFEILMERFALRADDPAVVRWAGVAGTLHMPDPGWWIEAVQPGTVKLEVRYGGAALDIPIRVVNVVLSKTDGVDRCGLTPEGEAWCVGPNDWGELGTLTVASYQPCCMVRQEPAKTPVAVDADLRFQSIASGQRHSCAIDLTGRVHCWGRSEEGQLAVPTDSSGCYNFSYPGLTPVRGACSFRPVPADSLLGQRLVADSVAATGNESCARVVARGPAGATSPVSEVWCWGGRFGRPPQQRPGFFQ